jgi:hypothetical protein
MKRCSIRTAVLLVLFASVAQLAKADETISYSFGPFIQTQLLNDGTLPVFDTLSLAGHIGTTAPIPVGSSTTVGISTVTWGEGYSCSNTSGCNAVATQIGNAVFNATINGITESLSVPFKACLGGGFSTCAGVDDTVQLFASAPISFNLGDGNMLVLTVLDMAQISGNLLTPANNPTGTLEATFQIVATPEPATMLLYGTGIFLIGGILRRRLI